MSAMLPDTRLTAFVASTDLARSEGFYVQTLGLALIDANPYALVVDGSGAQVRISLVEEKATAEYTVLGWEVDDLDRAIDDLAGRGVRFTVYDGMGQDERGAWQAPDGSRVAWFKDPDGNTLSLHQG
jgi:catechol 2,3-dioxygenase-like lactoylglutathione lyase family enzyme